MNVLVPNSLKIYLVSHSIDNYVEYINNFT